VFSRIAPQRGQSGRKGGGLEEFRCFCGLLAADIGQIAPIGRRAGDGVNHGVVSGEGIQLGPDGALADRGGGGHALRVGGDEGRDQPVGHDHAGGDAAGQAKQLVEQAGVELGQAVAVPGDAQTERAGGEEQQPEGPAPVDARPARVEAEMGRQERREGRGEPEGAVQSQGVQGGAAKAARQPQRARSGDQQQQQDVQPVHGVIVGRRAGELEVLCAIIIPEVIRVAAARAAGRVSEESPDSPGQRCRLTAGRGDPPESATETYRPLS